MSWPVAVAVLAAAGFAGCLLLAVGLLTGRLAPDGARSAAWRERAAAVLTVRLAVAVLAGVVVLVVTGWVAVAVGVGLSVGLWPRLFGAVGEQQEQIVRLEALAMWVESLRDVIERGRGLPEAIAATQRNAPAELRAPLAGLVARMAAREPLDRALLSLADDLADPVADQVVAALVLNARASGRRLPAVLGALATSTRRQVDVRRQVEAQRAGPRRGVKIVVIVTVLLVVAFALASPGYLTPFRTVTGQLVLTGAVGCFAAGFAVLRALASFDSPARFLSTQLTRRQQAAAAGPAAGWLTGSPAGRPAEMLAVRR